MNEEPITINCACGDANCGMKLEVLPVAGHFKLTLTPRLGAVREPATEWISPDRLIDRLNGAGCAFFGSFQVYHYLNDDLDLDIEITEADRQQLLKMAKGEHGKTNQQRWHPQQTGFKHAGPRQAQPDAPAAGSMEVPAGSGAAIDGGGIL